MTTNYYYHAACVYILVCTGIPVFLLVYTVGRYTKCISSCCSTGFVEFYWRFDDFPWGIPPQEFPKRRRLSIRLYINVNMVFFFYVRSYITSLFYEPMSMIRWIRCNSKVVHIHVNGWPDSTFYFWRLTSQSYYFEKCSFVIWLNQ